MSIEFLKQSLFWDFAFFFAGVALVLIGWCIWKIIERSKGGKSRFLRRIEKALDIEKKDDGIYVHGDLACVDKKR